MMNVKEALALIAMCAAPVAVMGGLAAVNATASHATYRTDWTFAGDRVVVETRTGRLGLELGHSIVGHYLAGRPSVVAFGCAGHDMPLIATDASALPHCERVEPVTND